MPVSKVSVIAEGAPRASSAPHSPADVATSLGAAPAAGTPTPTSGARAARAQPESAPSTTPRTTGDRKAPARPVSPGRGVASSARGPGSARTAPNASVRPTTGASAEETAETGVSFGETLAASLAESTAEPDPPSAVEVPAKSQASHGESDSPTPIAALVALMGQRAAPATTPDTATAAASATAGTSAITDTSSTPLESLTTAAASTADAAAADLTAIAAPATPLTPARQSTITTATRAGAAAAASAPGLPALPTATSATPPATDAQRSGAANEDGFAASGVALTSPFPPAHGTAQSPPPSPLPGPADVQVAAAAPPMPGAEGALNAPTTNNAPATVTLPGDATATTAVAAQAPLHVPVGASGWSDELGVRLTVMAHTGVGSASLRLTPENLGPLEVRIAVRDSSASVWFGAQHPDTRLVLEQALPRLRELFAAQGLNLTDTGVSREPPGETQRNPQGATAASGSAPPDATGSVVTTDVRARAGLIDTYA